MKLTKNIALMMMLFVGTTVFGQEHLQCGLHDHDILIERLLKNKKYLEETGIQSRDGAITYVPIKYHLIGKSDGTSRISDKKVLDLHCLINEFYADGDDGLQFYIKDGFNYINHTPAYEDHTSASGQFQFNNNKITNAVNIFIPKDANVGSTLGVTLGYYSPNNDWIVIRRAEANGNSLTTPHELGHYFSLPHPFNGWDHTPYDASEHGVQVGTYSPDGILNEKMDGSNCNNAGDFICDTPPSYLFFDTNGCNYNGGAKDPNGDLVDPDEQNIMDYFDDSCTPKYFSAGQKAIILADYDQRPALHANWNPIATEITTEVEIVTPADESTIAGFEEVFFDWEPVSGADRYLIEVDRLSDFSLDPTVMVVTTSQATISGVFEAEKTYRWRVTPFNPYYTCATDTGIKKFTVSAGTSNKNVLEVSGWSVDPNPVSQGELTISMDTQDAFDAEITLLTTTGQAVKTIQHRFNAGQTITEMSVAEIPNGIYLLNVKSGSKLINKKIIVAK